MPRLTCSLGASSIHLLGTSFRTFNQEVFEQVLALAGLECAVAANARHFALGYRPWWGFKSDNFILCRADGAMEQRCYRFRHTCNIAIRRPRGSARRTGQTCIMAFVNLTWPLPVLCCTSTGSFAIFTAIRRASSFVPPSAGRAHPRNRHRRVPGHKRPK